MKHDWHTVGSVGKGWWPIVDRLHAAISKLSPHVTMLDIKEKFGGLRYYFTCECDPVTGDSYVTDEIQDQIDELVAGAETEAYRTCEDCGADGTAHMKHGWMKTLCEACNAE